MKRSRLSAYLKMAVAAGALGAAATGQAAAQEDPLLSEQRALNISDGAVPGAVGLANPRAAVADALMQRGASRATIDSLIQTDIYPGPAGRSIARFEQRINGLRVYGAYAKAAFDGDGRLEHLIARTASAGRRATPANISAADALGAAIEANFGLDAPIPAFAQKNGAVTTFAHADFYHQAPSVEQVLIARGQSALEIGYLVESWSAADNLLYHTLVDGLGRIVANELRTAQDSYNIFPDHPGNSAQTVTAGPGAGNAQSPAGWLAGAQTSLVISGNNVTAYLDRDANNVIDGGGAAVTDGNFLTSANLAQEPTTLQNQEVAVQNLFYFNNVIHDELYRHGFVEGAGNFQENNLGNGGAGSDSVNAEGQDGSGTNNANFATPADGSNPRMQMFLWTLTTPGRDGDVDSDIMWHEYGHGLTWRMIGSMSGDISGAIGEGMSDTLSIIINDDDRVGEYSTNDPNGVRSIRYSQHQDTLGDFNPSRGVHRNGEIYGATMWDLWTSYKASALTADTLLDDLVGGMNFTPAGPDYLDMRDGILAQTPASRNCLVWEAFAGRGMGEGASMSVKGGGPFGGGKVTVNESFTLPAECGAEPPPPPPSGDFTLNSLSGSSQTQGRNRWRAFADVNVSSGGAAAANATVSFSWSTGDQTSCTTDGSGACSSSLNLRNDTASVTVNVATINGGGFTLGAGETGSETILRP